MRVRRFVVGWGLAAMGACATTEDFASLSPLEQAAFFDCSDPGHDYLCGGADDGPARNQCLTAKAAIFVGWPSAGERRKWLEGRGCPASVLDGSVAATSAAEASRSKKPPGSSCQRSTECESDLCVRGGCVTVAMLVSNAPCVKTDKDGTATASIAKVQSPDGTEELVSSVSDTLRKVVHAARQKDIRDALAAHRPEMRSCVQRQTNLAPASRAAATLSIRVDENGRVHVPQTTIRDAGLRGTPLEGCLREAAARWQFPPTGKSYAIEAPLEVTTGEK